MKVFSSIGSLATVLALCGSGVAAGAAGKQVHSLATQAVGRVVERGYIIEFEDAAPLRTGFFASRAEDQHTAFREHLSKRGDGGVKYKTRFTWNDSKIFKGVSIRLAKGADVNVVRRAPGVKAVYPIQNFDLPPQTYARASAEAVKAACQSKEGFAPHVMTQVDRLHKKGYYGKGIKVGVIDSGIDYTHPALNGGLPAGTACFRKPECQIIGGYDFVGDSKLKPTPSDDPLALCPNGAHGSHVTGSIIANDTSLGFLGVAPQAKVNAYRVFTCNDLEEPPADAPAERGEPDDLGFSGDEDVIVSAMQRAYADSNDLITMSLGGPGSWKGKPTALVASRIAALGVPVIIAAANDGSEGAFYSADPASAELGISVSTVQSTTLSGYATKITGATELTELYILSAVLPKFLGSESKTFPLYIANDDCSDLPDGINKIAITLNDGCLDPLFEKGFKYVMLAFKPAPATTGYVDQQDADPKKPTANVYRKDALKLRAASRSGKQLSITFEAGTRLESRPNRVDGGLLTDFTTFGPTNDMLPIPNVAAPGGNIFSSVPASAGTYAVFSGTSMAAPYIAGIVAQYLSIKGKTPAVDIRSQLVAHSKPTSETKSANSVLASLGRGGAGLAQAFDTIFACASATPFQLALNDSVHFKGEHWITIKNIGKKVHKYTTTHLPAGTAQTSDSSVPGDFTLNAYPVPLTRDYASVSITPSAFTLTPGAEQKVKVMVKPPRKDQKAFPLYSGLIKFISDAPRSSLTVPYLGLAADISKRPVLDPTARQDFALPALTGAQETTFDQSEGEPVVDLSSAENELSIFYATSFGTPFYQAEIVSAETTFNATIKHNNVAARSLDGSHERLVRRRLHPLEQHHNLAARAHTDAIKKTATKPALFSDVVTEALVLQEHYKERGIAGEGGVIKFRITENLQRGESAFTLPEGRYRVLFRAQRVATDATLAASYDSWLSEPFTYRKAQ